MSTQEVDGSLVYAVEMESQCEDVDFLSVSCKLAHLSLDDIGECLGLQKSQVDDALKRVTDHHGDHNKVHLLLMKWREVNGDGATWGALIQCLQSLPEIADNIQGEFILIIPCSSAVFTFDYNYSRQIYHERYNIFDRNPFSWNGHCTRGRNRS